MARNTPVRSGNQNNLYSVWDALKPRQSLHTNISMVRKRTKLRKKVHTNGSQPTQGGTVWQLQMPANRDQLKS